MTPTWDLLIRGGRLLDPASGIDRVGDVAIVDGKIAAVGDVERRRAKRVVNAAGLLVLPGLIDLHAHVYEHVTGDFGLNADLVGVHSGVTCLVDQGGPSAVTIGGFRKFIAEPAETRIFCFISNYVAGGLVGHKYVDLYGPGGIDPKAVISAAEANRDLVKGIKAHAEPGGYSRWGIEPLRLAKEASRALNIPVYVHLGTLWSEAKGSAVDPDTILRAMVPLLDPGDILAHPFTRLPSGFVTPEGEVHPLIREAVAKGVRLDVGRGSHINFETARRVLDAGLLPFTVSADLHGYNVRSAAVDGWYKGVFLADGADAHDEEFSFVSPYSLQHAMSEMLALGVPLADVVRMATANPATVLGLEEELGRIAVGRPADLSLVVLVNGRWTLQDSSGNEIVAKQMIHPRMAVRGGRAIAADSPLLPDLQQLAG